MQARTEPSRSLAASSGVILLARLVANVGFFLAVLVLARTLGPEGRGTLAFLTVMTLVVGSLVGFGVTAANSVFVPQRPAQRSTLLTNVVAFTIMSSGVIGSIVFGSLILFSQLGPASVSHWMYALCIPATASAALSNACLGFLIATNRAVWFGATVIFSAWIYAILLLALDLLTEVTPQSALVAWVAASLLSCGVAIAAASRRVGFGRFNPPLLRESIRFGFRAWLGGLAGFLNFRLDQVLMAYLATEAALGLYVVAVNASEILLYLPTAVGLLLAPTVARTEHSERDAAVMRAFRGTLLITVVAVAVGALVGPVLIPLAFGAEFDGSVVPFLLLLPGAVGFVMMRLFSSALIGSSHPGRSSVAPVTALTVSVLLDLALIPGYDASGAAAAGTVGAFAGGIVAVVLYRRVAPGLWRTLIPTGADAADLYRSLRRVASRT
jgi:O-antigen/teichoic acid export membrane protein